jgi:hypothetical protein
MASFGPGPRVQAGTRSTEVTESFLLHEGKSDRFELVGDLFTKLVLEFLCLTGGKSDVIVTLITSTRNQDKEVGLGVGNIREIPTDAAGYGNHIERFQNSFVLSLIAPSDQELSRQTKEMLGRFEMSME